MTLDRPLVLEVLDTLAPADTQRHLDEVSALVERMKAAPHEHRPIDFELRRQAFIRRGDNDPTWRAWLAWAEARELASTVEHMWAVS